LGYCDAACALLDVSPVPTFETSPSFGAFFIQEMVKANMVSIAGIESLLLISNCLQELNLFVLEEKD
jgi:hypothetical protein